MFVYVTECQKGQHSVEGPHGLVFQSTEPLQKGGGKTPSTTTSAHTQDPTSSPRREKNSHLLSNCSGFDNNIVTSLENISDINTHTHQRTLQ